MKFLAKFILKLGFATGIVLLSSFTASFADCFSWEAARDLIKHHNLLNAGTIRQNSKDLGGQVIELKLCEQNGQYVYHVGVLVPGKVRYIMIDARSGLAVGERGQKAIDYAGTAGEAPAKTYRNFKFEPDAYDEKKK